MEILRSRFISKDLSSCRPYFISITQTIRIFYDSKIQEELSTQEQAQNDGGGCPDSDKMLVMKGSNRPQDSLWWVRTLDSEQRESANNVRKPICSM